MKKAIKCLSVMMLGLFLVSCSDGNSADSSASSNPASGESTSYSAASSVYIAGSSSVRVGATIQLSAALDSGEDDSFTWSSSDSSIASVDSNGNVTGIAEGDVTIYATSASYPSLVGEKSISVIADQATSVTMSVEGYSPDSSGIYNIPIGTTFRLVLSTGNATDRTPDSYAFVGTTSSDATPSYLTITNNGDGTADAVAYASDTNVTIKGTASYSASSTSLSDALVFSFYDDNASDYASFQSFVSSFREVEAESLVSSTITRTIAEDDTTSVEKAVNTIYDNATYTTIDDNGVVTDYYSGYYSLSNSTRYYSFSYDENEKVVDLYNNESVSDQSNAGLTVDYHSGPYYYGIADIISSYLCGSSSLTGSFLPIGNSNIYASSTFSEDASAWYVYSSYTDADTARTYRISFHIDKDADNVISGYTFTETVSSSSSTSTYTEVVSDLVFSSTKGDNTSADDVYIDINSYYITAYHLEDITGNSAYEYYQSEDKYGADSVETEVYNGETINHYTISNNKSLAIAVIPDAPSTASTYIDSITASAVAAVDDTTVITTPSILGNGIALLNAPQDDDGVSTTSDCYVTFETINNITHTIRVTFTQSEASSLVVDHVTDNTFDSIFRGEYSDYCLINTDNDSLAYTYALVIDEGSAGGIELYAWGENNSEGMPSYSYSIYGVTVGTYKFHFVTNEDANVKSEQFSITVEEPYSISYLEANIVGNDYICKPEGSSYSWTASFESSTNIEFSEKVSYSSEILSQDIAYHFETGAIVTDAETVFSGSRSGDDVSTSVNLGFYFYSLRQGEITYSRDLKTLTFYLATAAEGGGEDSNASYVKYEFTLDESEEKSDLASYINGNTYTTKVFNSTLGGQVTVSVTFQDGAATLVVEPTAEGYDNITATFSYTYDSSLEAMSISNFTSSDSLLTLYNSTAYYNSSSSELTIRMCYNASYSNFQAIFTI